MSNQDLYIVFEIIIFNNNATRKNVFENTKVKLGAN